jgi:2-phosphosulfolactate phosphatase
VIDVAFTRAELKPAGIAVVIDVLRATSTATQALAAGYQKVVFADSIERARGLRRPGRVLAGERHCVMPDGFDQGNSPLEAARLQGLELVLATTNGAPTIVLAAKRARLVLLGSLLNLNAAIAAVLSRNAPEATDILLVCSGTDGAPAVEDVYAAGRISAALPGTRTDAALIAEAVARAYGTPAEALAASADAQTLREKGMSSDITYCARTSELDCVPVVVAAGTDVAIVADRAATGPFVSADADERLCASATNSALDGSGTVGV